MNYPALLSDILDTYEKHGWNVSRVLLSATGQERLSDEPRLDGLPVVESEFDAVWLERPSRNGKLAIELRWLKETPFALFELVDRDATEKELDEIRSRIELKLSEHASGGDKK